MFRMIMALVLLFCAQRAVAAPSEEVGAETLSKGWGGARRTLADRGVDLSLVYKGELNSNFSGGANRATVFLGNLDIRACIDGEKAIGWKGASGLIYILADHGGRPSTNIGDAQVTSNIEVSAPAIKLYEAWVQQSAYEGRVSVLFGLHDLNSEFYVTETSGLFFHSSFGIGTDFSQSGVNGPSIFPATALAMRLRVEPAPSFYLQTAAFNAQSGDPQKPRGTHISLAGGHGTLWVSEAAFLRGTDDSGRLPGKYGLGVWNYTNVFDRVNASIQTDPADPDATVPVRASSHGAYFMADQALTDALSVFIRYGIASPEVNQFSSALGTGMVFTGLIPGRAQDRFGVAVARAENGDEYKLSQVDAGTPASDAETTLEINYRIEVLPGLAIQPDFQYVVNPGTDPTLHDASVAAIRFELSF